MVFVVFSKGFWSYFEMVLLLELIDFFELGEGEIYVLSMDVDVLIYCYVMCYDLLFYILCKGISDIV